MSGSPLPSLGFLRPCLGMSSAGSQTSGSSEPHPSVDRDRFFSVVDVETTGLSPGVHRIVEVGVVVPNEDLEVVVEWSTLINPQQVLTGPKHIHGVSPSMLRSAPTFVEVAAELLGVLEGTVLVAHNLEFDSSFLFAELRRAGLVPDPVVSLGIGVCTLSLTDQDLVSAAAACGVEVPESHAALADARTTAALLPHLHRNRPWWRASYSPVRLSRPASTLPSSDAVLLPRHLAVADPLYDLEATTQALNELDAVTGWRSKPVTSAQRRRLTSLGLDPRRVRNRGEASDLISEQKRRLLAG